MFFWGVFVGRCRGKKVRKRKVVFVVVGRCGGHVRVRVRVGIRIYALGIARLRS